jgi:hypothetical protein
MPGCNCRLNFQRMILQDALMAVLATALDICDLPFQCPLLHMLNDAYYLQPTCRQGVLALYRNEESSTLFSTSPSFSSSFNLAESTFWVIPSKQLFSSEKRLEYGFPLSPVVSATSISWQYIGRSDLLYIHPVWCTCGNVLLYILWYRKYTMCK